MPNNILILRSNTAGNVPAGATPAGSPWVNWNNMSFGVADGTAPRQLLAVRFWTVTTAYAVGDHVLSGGNIYRATSANTGSTPPSANWALAGGAVTSVAGKTGAVTLQWADITDGPATLLPYALLAGAAFTGPTSGITRAPGDNTINFATTQFVTAAVSAATTGVSSVATTAPITTSGPTGAITIGLAAAGVTNAFLATMPANTFKGNATAGVAAAVDVPAATVLTSIGAYPATNPNGYQTAAQVSAVLPGASGTNPIVDGVAAPGVSALYSRGDHVHPSDGSKLNLTGGTVTGQINGITPVAAANLTTKNYVDTQIASLALYQGVWNPATNSPALPATGVPGGYYLASPGGTTGVVHPGIPSGTAIALGSLIIWDTNTSAYDVITGAGMTTAAGDARYVNLTGDTMTGALTLSADPAGPLQPVTLQYLQNYPIDAGTF